ncbi:hypothetical protein AVEN_223239-2-1, partial [Araneus ventricosus]
GSCLPLPPGRAAHAIAKSRKDPKFIRPLTAKLLTLFKQRYLPICLHFDTPSATPQNYCRHRASLPHGGSSLRWKSLLVKSRWESDDAEMSSSSLSEEDALSDMSEDLKTNCCYKSSTLFQTWKADKYKYRGGFSNQTNDNDSDDEDAILADLKEKWKTVEGNGRITDDATLSDILEVDAELLTVSYPTDEKILKNLMDNNKGQENDSYSENEDVIQPKPHGIEMLQSFETIKRGFQMEENTPDSIFSSLIKCEFL